MTDSVQIALITTIPATLLASAALVTSWHNRGTITEVRKDFDGKVDKLLAAKDQVADLRADASYVEGKADQKKISGTADTQ
jgi:hypothetical protein